MKRYPVLLKKGPDEMAHYQPEKLHINFEPELNLADADLPRCYTLTHSDRTGDLFLTIARNYDKKTTSGWYTRLMRDEVFGEWKDADGLALHIHCHVSGGFVFGPAKWREAIFKQHLPLVLEAIINGDRLFITSDHRYQNAGVKVHFHAKQSILDQVENWGCVDDYLIAK
jgi:hypothetical protein